MKGTIIVLFLIQGGTRGQNPRGAGRAHPPITLHDLDVYFASLRRVDSRHSLGGITYNINNGVQIVGAPPMPPPYSATVSADHRLLVHDPPPPYNAAIAHPRVGEIDQVRVINSNLRLRNKFSEP
jgi:hypothetical protein